MDRSIPFIRQPVMRWVAGGTLAGLLAPPAAAGLVDELLAAADRGQCIEAATFQMIQRRGPSNAGPVVQAALAALARRERQQHALGCDGDIAAQAISAGADPEQVLKASAAGL